jgi:hypothetical protein
MKERNMVDFKTFNLKHIGHLVTLGVILVIIIALITLFVSPILTTVLPGVFATSLTLTDTLLFMLLVVLLHQYK